MEQFFNFGRPESQPVQPEKKESGFLSFEGQKEDVYEASLNLANYLKAEKIPNVMFLDNSARQAYVGLKEAWKTVGEGEKEPHIYFINPDAVRFEADFSDLKEEFFEKYKNIDPADTILLYDVCIHSGETMSAVKSFFEYMGFKDVRLAVTSVNPDFPEEKKAAIDLICLDYHAKAGCRPFGRPSYIRESGSLISQSAGNQESRERGKLEHQRIKDAFKDQY